MSLTQNVMKNIPYDPILNAVLYVTEKNTLSFIETSALDSTNVEEAFKNILTGEEESNVFLNPQSYYYNFSFFFF